MNLDFCKVAEERKREREIGREGRRLLCWGKLRWWIRSFYPRDCFLLLRAQYDIGISTILEYDGLELKVITYVLFCTLVEYRVHSRKDKDSVRSLPCIVVRQR